MAFKTGGTDLASLGLVPKTLFNDLYPSITKVLIGPSLWTWGSDTYGQLGDETLISSSSPIQTSSGGTNWKQAACGFNHTAAIKTDGTLWTWGGNGYGQLGNNSFLGESSSPVQTAAGGTNWKQVSCGNTHTYTAAIKTDGTLWSWGFGLQGQMGDSTLGSKSSPVQTICGGTDWKQVSNGSHTTAIKTDGTLWTWGNNSFGQLGDNSKTHRSSPVQTIAGGTTWKQVSSGLHTAAIKTDGTLWTWGNNSFGQLGDNTAIHRSSPVQTIAGGTTWKQVSCGFHTAAIKTDGTLWTWGNNLRGQLGDNTQTYRSSPVQTIAGGTNWKSVKGGYYSTIALKTDGTVWTWGNNTLGILGDNTQTDRSSPVQTIAGGTSWKQVDIGASATAAIQESDSTL